MFKNFLKVFFISSSILLIFAISVNLFSFYKQINLPDSLKQAINIEQIKPQTVILGSSRVRYIDPDSKNWESSFQPIGRIFSTMESVQRMQAHIEHIFKFSNPSNVIICVDFFTFSVYNQGPPDNSESYFLSEANLKSSNNKVSILFFKLYRTLTYTLSFKNFKDNLPLLYPFIFQNKRPEIEGIPCLRDRVLVLENWMIDETFFISPVKQFTYTRDDGSTIFQDFEKLLEFLYHKKVNTTVIINPFHVRIFELVHVSNLWPHYKEWLNGIVNSVQKTALKRGAKAFPILDFSGYSAYNTEDFDLINSTEPRWYMESSHFNFSLGNILIENFCKFQSQGIESLEWGIELNSNNLQEHIHNLELHRQEYIDKHPQLNSYFKSIQNRFNNRNALLKIQAIPANI